jgi:hypothetical protein
MTKLRCKDKVYSNIAPNFLFLWLKLSNMQRKLYHIIILLLVILLSPQIRAQDTLTVMQYNLLEYGNYNSGFADCYETNNNTQRKDECVRTLMDYVKPDILTVCEFGATQTLLDGFLRHNLNVNGAMYWKSDNIINYAGSNIINHIFYDSRKMGLKSHVALHTSPRDTDVYELYLKTKALAVGDTIKLVCIVAHPKAGQGYEASRRALMQVAMDYVNQHYASDNVLIMGDFNMYGASESGYRLLTQTYSNPQACFIDPLYSLNGVGEWNNNSQYAPFHTQSTRSYSDECFSSGGLDDRFDFILMADEIAFSYKHLRYVANSYHAVGNDGRHFNQSVDQGYNAAVPAEVAEALFDGSDHLPVTMKIAVDTHLGVSEMEQPRLQASIAPNPVMNVATVYFNNPKEGKVCFEICSLQGQVVMSKAEYFSEGARQFVLPLDDLVKGFYLLRIGNEVGGFETLKLMKQ